MVRQIQIDAPGHAGRQRLWFCAMSGLLGDLFGTRPLPPLSGRAMNYLDGKRVLVTGAAGSIGSELVRQLWQLTGEMPYILDVDESRMHGLVLSLTDDGLLGGDRIVLADIRDRSRIDRVLRDVRPDVVFHAAANKHLTLLERFPCEAVKTNVLGTEIVASACVRAGVERFVFVSTDKAADPTSVLGATKRLGEMITQEHSCRVSAASVRFGNVLASRGSFLHILHRQMEQNVPVTVTDPDVTRYFMSIPEAAQLVIEASSSAVNGDVYVLDMGEPVRIVDLVRRYAEHVGLPCPEIVFTGLRHGEKLHESLFASAEIAERSWHPRISVSTPAPLRSNVVAACGPLIEAALAEDDELTTATLFGLMPAMPRLPSLVTV